MTTSAEGGSSSSSRAKGHKNKEMVREDPIEEEESHESESEDGSDDEPAPKKRTRAPKPPKKKKPPPSEITRFFKAMELLPTTYPDPLILQRLVLYDDVTILLGRMGLERLLTLQKPVYATATYQFLSSLEATHRSREDPEDGYGFITFKIGRQDYRMSFKQISEVMGFPDRRDPRIEGTKEDPELLWYMIGAGVYNTKLIKGADIRNPSIRYVQRILASTFYARKDPGRIVEDELHFLTWCLKDVIGEMFDDGSEVRFGIRTQPGIVGIFVKRLLHYQDWAWTKKDKEPRLSIEGLITPLLEAMEVPLPEADKGYALMDEPFLTNIGFLDGQVGNSWVYRFKVVKQEGKYVRTFLPNQSLTSISERNNIKFRLPQEAFYNSEIPKKISRSKKKQAIDDSQPEEQAEQGSSSSIYGSSRYYFPPYSGALPDGPLREAHQQIRTLKRGNKFQDRTIAKLVKSVNYLAKKLKNLTMRPRRSRASTLVTTDDPMEDDGTGVEEEPVHTHRHSYHGDASATEVYYEEPRASLREPRQRKPRRQRHPVTQLPPNDSGNETPYLKRRELVYLLSVGYMRNHNTVGGLGEEALFPVYWNGDNWHVLRVQKLLPITWNFHIITRSGAEEGINPLGFFASHADLKVPGICEN
ncbi:hypothetical protein F2Q69_00028441 [Brassica cretica]|uniref:Arabidopsis retrotransposon Orf1 C-terminal domain-containing protein n=1 Tax=Brassica cretica TaxID=69181 RepID=A0A8S9RXP7_BRACR|nr:hypothetical protein F2Q69_00028441 [Brassica cretica]